MAGKGQVNCYCCSGETKKFGRFQNHNRIVQRYRCLKCGKTMSESQPLDGLRVDFKQACQVVNLLCESMGIRAVSRLTGLNQETVLNILETAGQKAAAFLDAKVRNVNASVVQADEVYTFVGCRQENALPKETERGGQFTFLSVARDSKLIINWLVGKRTRDNADQFFGDLKTRMANRMQLVTDGYKGYSGVGGTVASVFGKEVDYCTETKYFGKPGEFLPRQVIGFRRRRRIGNPDITMATTAHAERTNLSVRTFTRRFTRCTLGHSKKLENHKLAVALFVAHFNFCRVHSAHGQTPAMAAKLTDHAWTIEEMLSATI